MSYLGFNIGGGSFNSLCKLWLWRVSEKIVTKKWQTLEDCASVSSLSRKRTRTIVSAELPPHCWTDWAVLSTQCKTLSVLYCTVQNCTVSLKSGEIFPILLIVFPKSPGTSKHSVGISQNWQFFSESILSILESYIILTVSPDTEHKSLEPAWHISNQLIIFAGYKLFNSID